MAIKVDTNKVYKCISATIGSASIQVINGSVKLRCSNVTKNDENDNLIVPKMSDLVVTDDNLDDGINLLAGLPEWIAFEGTADEIWIKAAIDVRFIDYSENS